MNELEPLVDAFAENMPEAMRWGGTIARRLRHFNIALEDKGSGSASTDALTLADLTVQELLVSALRDTNLFFRHCRLEAEESTGELSIFSPESPWTIAIDPIDGTKQYRDKTGNGYAVMMHFRVRETVLHSLVFIPELGPQGTWVEVGDFGLRVAADDTSQRPRDVLNFAPPLDPRRRAKSNKIYVVGFQAQNAERARELATVGLYGVDVDAMPGCICELFARGDFAGCLVHTPNVYDFPISLHIARRLGGDAVWVHNRQPVHFGDTWLDERAKMLRLPGIVACSDRPDVLDRLCTLARDWNPERYAR